MLCKVHTFTTPWPIANDEATTLTLQSTASQRTLHKDTAEISGLSEDFSTDAVTESLSVSSNVGEQINYNEVKDNVNGSSHSSVNHLKEETLQNKTIVGKEALEFQEASESVQKLTFVHTPYDFSLDFDDIVSIPQHAAMTLLKQSSDDIPLAHQETMLITTVKKPDFVNSTSFQGSKEYLIQTTFHAANPLKVKVGESVEKSFLKDHGNNFTKNFIDFIAPDKIVPNIPEFTKPSDLQDQSKSKLQTINTTEKRRHRHLNPITSSQKENAKNKNKSKKEVTQDKSRTLYHTLTQYRPDTSNSDRLRRKSNVKNLEKNKNKVSQLEPEKSQSEKTSIPQVRSQRKKKQSNSIEHLRRRNSRYRSKDRNGQTTSPIMSNFRRRRRKLMYKYKSNGKGVTNNAMSTNESSDIASKGNQIETNENHVDNATPKNTMQQKSNVAALPKESMKLHSIDLKHSSQENDKTQDIEMQANKSTKKGIESKTSTKKIQDKKQEMQSDHKKIESRNKANSNKQDKDIKKQKRINNKKRKKKSKKDSKDDNAKINRPKEKSNKKNNENKNVKEKEENDDIEKEEEDKAISREIRSKTEVTNDENDDIEKEEEDKAVSTEIRSKTEVTNDEKDARKTVKDNIGFAKNKFNTGYLSNHEYQPRYDLFDSYYHTYEWEPYSYISSYKYMHTNNKQNNQEKRKDNIIKKRNPNYENNLKKSKNINNKENQQQNSRNENSKKKVNSPDRYVNLYLPVKAKVSDLKKLKKILGKKKKISEKSLNENETVKRSAKTQSQSREKQPKKYAAGHSIFFKPHTFDMSSHWHDNDLSDFHNFDSKYLVGKPITFFDYSSSYIEPYSFKAFMDSFNQHCHDYDGSHNDLYHEDNVDCFHHNIYEEYLQAKVEADLHYEQGKAEADHYYEKSKSEAERAYYDAKHDADNHYYSTGNDGHHHEW